MEEPTSLGALPNELLVQICGYMTEKDCWALRNCSRRLFNVATPFARQSLHLRSDQFYDDPSAQEFLGVVGPRVQSLKISLRKPQTSGMEIRLSRLTRCLYSMTSVETITLVEVQGSNFNFAHLLAFILRSLDNLHTLRVTPIIGAGSYRPESGYLIHKKSSAAGPPLRSLELVFNLHPLQSWKTDYRFDPTLPFIEYLGLFVQRFLNVECLQVTISGIDAGDAVARAARRYLYFPRLKILKVKASSMKWQPFTSIVRAIESPDVEELAVEIPPLPISSRISALGVEIVQFKHLVTLHLRHNLPIRLNIQYSEAAEAREDDELEEVEKLCSRIPSLKTVYRYFRARPGVCLQYCTIVDEKTRARKLKLVGVLDREYLPRDGDGRPWLFAGTHSLCDYFVDGAPF